MPHLVSWVVIVALLGWSMYRRVRRSITFQPLRPSRFTVRMVLFTVIGLLYLAGVIVQYPLDGVWAVIGLLLGGILAYFAIRTTEFRPNGGQWLYRPHSWIGVILIVLFIGRIAFRAVEVSSALTNTTAAGPAGMQAYQRDPLTTGVFFILIAYYLGYYTFLIWRYRHLRRETPMADEQC